MRTRRRIEQLAARRAHNPEVVGSSPTPAKKQDRIGYAGSVFFIPACSGLVRVDGVYRMPILWTFENPDKLKPFTVVLTDNNIPFEILSKSGKVDPEVGLIISVDDYDFKKAKKVLLNYRKRISNRHNK
jgi:hypothetical protein